MATGDVQGSVERLRSELRHIRYPSELDCTGAKLGVPAAFLPVLNYVLLKFSRHVAHQLVSAGYELQGKTDARFVEAAFKIIRDKFGLRPVLTAAQFLEQGFAERKLMLVSDVIAYCKSFHNAAVRRARLAAASAPTKSGRDAAMNGKGGASQLSTGSRKSKSKSGLPRAPQQPRVQRHSAAASEADTASAAAALQARLGPSSAQLAHVDQSQNIDPNPWGPPAHALGTRPLSSGHPPASHASHCYATASGHTSHDRPSEQGSVAWHEHRQQQHTLESNSQQIMDQAKVNMPDAKQAWFVNPAFGSESPMPSPEKQPRRQGPPLPHPSTYSGVAGPQSYDHQQPGSQPGFFSASDHTALRHVSPQQHSQDASRSVSYSHHASHLQQQEVRHTSLQAPSLAGGVLGPAHSSLHQQPPYRFPAVVTSHAQLEPNTWSGWQPAQGHDADQVLKSGHASPHQQHLHRRHVFPSMPARQQQLSQQAGTSDRLHEAPLQRPATAIHSQTSPTKLPQHAHHPPSSPNTGSQHQQDRMQEEYYHEQLQSQLAEQALGKQQQLQEQELGRHQQRDSGGSARHGLGGADVAGYVQGLQQRLAAAEEQAAQARQEGERRAHTLEARITVLEGRVRFVEGELAAERERNAPATHCKPADSSSMHRTGVVAVCLSPAAAKSRQDQMAAGPAARHVVPMPAVETPHQCKGAAASPTRSTAGTPGHRPGRLGVSRQLGLSALGQQSPARSLRAAAAAAAAPPSPASSMHSYRSTSELIESIQNRYLEAQSFLKSYKL